MLVNIRTSTAFCGEDYDEVYEFPDETTEKELDDYCDQLAYDRACEFGIEEQDVEPDIYGGWQILKEIHRHKIIEEYGDILTP